MWQNMRCSILFHLLVPGGKWQTVIFRPVSSANSCKATFHKRDAATVAAAAVGRDQQFVRLRISVSAHLVSTNGGSLHGELGRVVVDADTHPAFVAAQVVDAVGNGLAQCSCPEVMRTNLFRVALGPPLPPAILEIAHQFLLFRVHRDGRLPATLKAAHLLVDVLELCVAVGMLIPFARLAVACRLYPRFWSRRATVR